MAYVYRHIRLDKNEPFYIGIGKDESTFKRAHNKASRNTIWKRIVAKSKYEIEIMMTELTWEEAQEKEREFIALYGRLSDGGCLCNLTIGGDGYTGMFGVLNPLYGRKMSEQTKEKMKLSFKKTMESHPKHHYKKPLNKSRRCYPNKPVWNRGKKMTHEQLMAHRERIAFCEKPVVALDVYGRVCFHFKSIAEAARELGYHKGNISIACKGKRGNKVVKTYKGYIWKFRSEFPDDQAIYDWTMRAFKASTDCPTYAS